MKWARRETQQENRWAMTAYTRYHQGVGLGSHFHSSVRTAGLCGLKGAAVVFLFLFARFFPVQINEKEGVYSNTIVK